MDELGVLPIGDVMGGFGMCSIPASLGDFIYVITGNGRGFGSDVPSPFAPALVCLGKHTGKVVFVTTPHDIVARMFELAKVRKSDVVVDLGSGDGRYVIAAAKQYGCKAIGYEIDARLVAQSRELVAKESLQDLARIEHKDIFTLDLSGADVITVFLYPRLMERLIPQFDKLKPGSRIVSHQFEMPGIKPDQEIHLESKETGEKHRVLLWTTPLKKQ